MHFIFITLTVISLIVLIAGFVMLLMGSGKVQHRSGEDVGAEIMDNRMDDDDEITLAQALSFKGIGSDVQVEASLSFAEIKEAAASGNWQQALPGFLAIGGMIGLIGFGSLAVFFILEDKLIGGIILAIIAYAVIRLLIGFVRA